MSTSLSNLSRVAFGPIPFVLLPLLATLAGPPNVAAEQAAAAKQDAQKTISVTKRTRVKSNNGTWEIRSVDETWDARKTSVIVCDMWDAHHCLNATRRVGELAPRINRVLEESRRRGALIIHAPSSCMKFYEDHPARKRAQHAPQAENLPEQINEWCHWKDATEQKVGYPIDHSDGGEDDDPIEHKQWHAKLKAMGRNPDAPWIRQAEALKIDPDQDAITDSGVETWNLLEQRGVENVILVGVHTNMCVLGRPFGLRQLARNGRNVVLMRDMTDTMYNPQRRPYVSHFRGTDLVVEHIEKHVCSTVTSDQLLGGEAFRFKNDQPPHIVFMIGEREYDTRTSLPEFAKRELSPRGFRITFVQAGGEDGNDFPGLVALKDADLLVISVRRRTPKQAQLSEVRSYIESGRPVIGLRTASHAFDREPPGDDHAAWPKFDDDILGGDYQGHHGNKPPDAPYTLIRITHEGRSHPIMRGVRAEEFQVTSHLYRNRHMAATTTTLMTGRVDGRDHTTEPVSWVNDRDGQRIFYASLGNLEDFRLAAFRRTLLNAICWTTGYEPPE